MSIMDRANHVLKNLSLIFAMQGEGQALVEKFCLEQSDSGQGKEFGFLNYQGTVGELNLHISFNGKDPRHAVDNIGTEISSLNTYLVIEQYRPDLLINAGTAGGFAEHGAQIGDLYISKDRIVFHDRRIQLDGFYEYGIGSYPVFELKKIPQILNLKSGVISSGSSLDYTAEDARYFAQSKAIVKDMEAAAIARIAEVKSCPFTAIKSITDYADHPDNHRVFTSNYGLACARLCESLEQLIIYLSDLKTFDQL